MQCDAISKLLHEEPQGALADPVIAAHLGGCASCRAVHQELCELQQGLRQLEAPELPPGFELALRRRLLAEAPAVQAALGPAGRRTRRLSRRLALAASLLLALGLGLWLARPQPAPATSHFRLALQVQAATDVPAAVFQITLPAGFELAGGLAAELGEGQTLRWRSALIKGTNAIALPLVGAGREPAVVQAQITVAGQSYRASTPIQAQQAAGDGSAPQLQLAWVLPPPQGAGLQVRP